MRSSTYGESVSKDPSEHPRESAERGSPDVRARTCEDLRDSFRSESSLTGLTFCAPVEGRLLALPAASALILSRGLAGPRGATGGAVRCDGSEFVFCVEGHSPNVESFKRIASRAGRMLSGVGVAERVEPTTNEDLCRWLWYVSDLVTNGRLPTVVPRRHLWSLDSLQGFVANRWDAPSLLKQAKRLGAVSPTNREALRRSLKDHFLLEIPDLWTASSEAVAVLEREIIELVRDSRESQSPSDRSASSSRIPPRAQKAADQYLKATEALGIDRPRDREAWELLKTTHDQLGESFPCFVTWTRNLRIWRRANGQQKSTRRAGRADGARSVVKRTDL